MSDPLTNPAGDSPPTLPADLAPPPRRAAWPIPIGVVAVVFGALGCIYALFGMSLPLWISLGSSFTAYTPGSATPVDPMAMMREYMWMFLLGYGLLGLACVVLVIAGIGVMQRRAWGGTVMRLWSVLGLLLALALGAGMGLFQAGMMTGVFKAAAANQPAGSPAPPPEVGYIAGAVTGVIVAVMFSLLPMFMLIWFSLSGVRAEVARWRERTGP